MLLTRTRSDLEKKRKGVSKKEAAEPRVGASKAFLSQLHAVRLPAGALRSA